MLQEIACLDDWQISIWMSSNHASTCAAWYNWSEWLQVYNNVYSDDVCLRQVGLERIALWRSRSSLPISIESTAKLVEIELHEQIAHSACSEIGQSTRSELELRMMYACVIVRCVNGLVDGIQNKNSIAMAVSTLAQRIGIPLWIVDLRHESTHNEFPMLPVLQFASSYLLSWLERNYWGRQFAILKDSVHAVMTHWTNSIYQMSDVSQSISSVKDRIGTKDNQLSPHAISNILVPLLVDGNQYGIPFHGTPLWKCQLTASKVGKKHVMTECERKILDELLKLQGIYSQFSSTLLERFYDRFVYLMFDHTLKELEDVKEEMSAILVWISLLVSQEWSIRLKKYSSDTMESVYQCGIQLLVSLKHQCHHAQLTNDVHLPELNQLYKILKACKPIRVHSHRKKLENMQDELYPFLQRIKQRKQKQLLQNNQVWMSLSTWFPCPLGSLSVLLKSIFTRATSYKRKRDENCVKAEDVITTATANCKRYHHKSLKFASDDEANDAAMSWHDHKYLQEMNSISSIREELVAETISQQQSGISGNVLSRKEVVRLQNSVAIW
ncbi:unnamed protein product [Albugo candida]|uniref:Uncharacterized protein n=1 Tax=Albugo candida TaxID=65357 RepID=A0A024G2S8_9STRA|nr:unnamed protein product [Albugo candida]|eukprot:CCI40941.1 unnamed protein product [Albugo candida]